MPHGRPMNSAPDETTQILTLLDRTAVFMGTALTIRNFISERAIFAAGASGRPVDNRRLQLPSYLWAKALHLT